MSPKEKIGLSHPSLNGFELEQIQQALADNWISTIGPQIDEFEAIIENFLDNNKKIVALNSGTSALHLALVLAGVKKGDKVLCPTFTFVASVNPIVYCQAEPIFVDSEAKSWNLDTQLLEKAIVQEEKKGKKPKFLVLVHNYGMPCEMESILIICKKHQIRIIEDAAEALGSSYKNQKCGTFGDFGVLSFNGNKIVTTSGGGALICKNNEEKEKAIYLATQAKEKAEHYQHTELGYNYRLSNLLAAVGIGQMKNIEDRIVQKREVNQFYKKNLEKSGFQFQIEPENCFSNFWLTAATHNSKMKIEKLKKQFTLENIEYRPLWKPMHMQPIYKNCTSYLNGNSEYLFNHGICFPSGIDASEEQLDRIRNVFSSVYKIS